MSQLLLLLFLLLILFLCFNQKIISKFTIPRARGCGAGDGQTAESCARYYSCVPYGGENPLNLPYCDARF
jgi:hypothetical protein